MSLTARDVARAEAFGRLAARTGQPVGACPYEANGGPDERVLAARFVRAYIGAGGRVSIDYEDGQGPTQGTPRRAIVAKNGKPVRVNILRRMP